MKKIKYKVSNNEAIGCIPGGVIIDVFLVYESSDIDGGLAYFPKNVKYIENGEEYIDRGCGCLSFVEKSDEGDFYIRGNDDYVNLLKKDAMIFEKQVRSLKKCS